MRFWVGGYAEGMGGDAEGISVMQAGDADSPWASGPLRVDATVVRASGSPSWLTPHPSLEVIYAALEGDGRVQAYRRTGETILTPLGRPVDAGEAVCHVAAAPSGRFLIASCWGDGRVVRIGLDVEGRPSTPWVAPAATDPAQGPGSRAERGAAALPDLAEAARALRRAAGEEYAHLIPHLGPDESAPAAEPPAPAERASHAHQAVFLPEGLIATTDMGLDLVRFWRAGSTGMHLMQELVLPRGTGPRHMRWHPSGHLYVLTERSQELFVLRPDQEGLWNLVSGLGVQGTVPGDAAAELAVSRDGQTLYAGIRGSDTLAVVRVRGAGEALQQVALVESGTTWPRHHVVVRDTVLVAGQRGSEIVSLPLDERTGVPGRVRHRVASPSPACILPLR